MAPRHLSLAVLLPIATMTSCQSATAPESRPQAAAQAAVPDVVAKPAPAPRKRHALTLAFADLPGPLAKIEATADFEVDNRDCVPLDTSKAIGGVRLPPQQSVPLALERLDDGRYAFVLHEDALLDEDYFGLGVCHWALRTVSIHFHSAATHFVGGLDADRLRADETVVQHYLARDFAEKPATMDVVFGETAGFYRPEAGPQFTLTITARREAP